MYLNHTIKVSEIIKLTKNKLNSPISTNFSLLYPMKYHKTLGFLILSGGIEVEHWLKMGKYVILRTGYSGLQIKIANRNGKDDFVCQMTLYDDPSLHLR